MLACSLKRQHVTTGKAKTQECERPDHRASIVGRQREMDAGARLTVSFLFIQGSQLMDPIHYTRRVSIPTSVNPI